MLKDKLLKSLEKIKAAFYDESYTLYDEDQNKIDGFAAPQSDAKSEGLKGNKWIEVEMRDQYGPLQQGKTYTVKSIAGNRVKVCCNGQSKDFKVKLSTEKFLEAISPAERERVLKHFASGRAESRLLNQLVRFAK